MLEEEGEEGGLVVGDGISSMRDNEGFVFGEQVLLVDFLMGWIRCVFLAGMDLVAVMLKGLNKAIGFEKQDCPSLGWRFWAEKSKWEIVGLKGE